MSKAYKDGYWIFIWYPDEEFLMMCFWPYGTDIWEAVAGSFSVEGMKHMREKDWQSYFIDTELTHDWKEAYKIAGAHFGQVYENGLFVA